MQSDCSIRRRDGRIEVDASAILHLISSNMPSLEKEITLALSDSLRLAVLIDADNASSSVVKELLEEVAKYGTATIKRAYGDWTTQNLVGWKNHLHSVKRLLQSIQQSKEPERKLMPRSQVNDGN